MALALGLGAFSIYMFVLRGCYAHPDTKTPFKVNVVENSINIVLAFVLVDRYGVLGLGLAFALVQLVVLGMQEDRPARHTLGELIGQPKAQLPFSFRYFQTLEQAVTLPEGFEAFEAEVQVRSGKLRFPMQQSFPWKADTATGT